MKQFVMSMFATEEDLYKAKSEYYMERCQLLEKYLDAYLRDIGYLSSCGRDSLNHVSCGTPYFETDEDMKKYIRTLQGLLQ